MLSTRHALSSLTTLLSPSDLHQYFQHLRTGLIVEPAAHGLLSSHSWRTTFTPHYYHLTRNTRAGAVHG